MRFPSLVFCAAAACQAVAAAVPEQLFLGETFTPKELEFFDGLATRTKQGKPDPLNYHPSVKLVNELYMSTSTMKEVAVKHVQKAKCPNKFVYAINTKGIEGSFLEVSALYAKQQKENPNPSEGEWLATARIPKKNIRGWYVILPDGSEKWVDREEYEKKMQEQAGERDRSNRDKGKCISGGCFPISRSSCLGRRH